ncbi:MAG: hypothetical protein COB14_02060 [Alphaproteobacteria bacterium]|nr:MAG: hypothetical protein COB14_02060 [Alphaproteobacteria bacterium]
MEKPFTELLSSEDGNDWRECFKVASCNIFHTMNTARDILEETRGRGNRHDSKDLIEVTKLILKENLRLKEGEA